ncbi:hypothetical protein KKF70_05360 [bacterium]|nr:hypothetical protein [bacterium]MBU3929089.1 hypothetical protein [bacterium]
MDNKNYNWKEEIESESAKIKGSLSHLLDKLPALNRIKLIDLYDELIKVISADNTVSANIIVFVFPLDVRKVLKFFDTVKIRFLNGMILYSLFHEIGEGTSYLNFFNIVGQIQEDENKIKDKKNENEPVEKKTLSLSKWTYSDLMGDILSSSFSPLTIDEQLWLIKCIEEKKRFKLTRKLTSFEKGFVFAQKSVLKLYLERTKRGYSAGSELLKIYKDLLIFQTDFTPPQRKIFYLSLFTSLQNSMACSISTIGEKKLIELLHELSDNKSEENIKKLQQITFDYQVIKKYLAKGIGTGIES